MLRLLPWSRNVRINFRKIKLEKKTTILEKSAILPISQTKNSAQSRSQFSRTTFVPPVVIAVTFPTSMQDSEQLFVPQLSVINFHPLVNAYRSAGSRNRTRHLPFPVRVPASATEFLGGPSADEVNYRRKRTRNASDLISTSLQEVPGLEESREPFSPPSSQNPGINPSESASAS